MNLWHYLNGYAVVERACGHKERVPLPRLPHNPDFWRRLTVVERYDHSLRLCAPCRLREASRLLIRFCDRQFVPPDIAARCIICGSSDPPTLESIHNADCPYAKRRRACTEAMEAPQ